MKRDKVISINLIMYIILLNFNKVLKIMGIPIFYFPMFFLLSYIVIKDLKDKKTLKINLFLVFWIIYAVMLIILYGSNLAATKALASLITNIFSFIIITRLLDKNFEVIKDIIKGVKISVLINILIAMWEIITNSHVIGLSEDYIRRFYGIPLTFFANANDLSVVLVSYIVILLIDICMKKNEKNSKGNMFFTIILILATYFIVLKTKSMIGICAVPCIILLTVLFKKYYYKKNKYFFLLIILIMGLTIYLGIGDTINLQEYSTIQSRIDIWGPTLAQFINYYGIGIGPGQNEVIGLGQVHSILIEILSEYGIVIFSIFIGIYFKWIQHTKKLAINSLENNILFFVILSYSLILLMLSISTSSMTKLYPVWGCIAICFAFIKKYEKKIGGKE